MSGDKELARATTLSQSKSQGLLAGSSAVAQATSIPALYLSCCFSAR